MAILKASNNNPARRIKSDELPPKGRYIAVCIANDDRFGVERQKFESTEMEIVDLTTFYFGFKTKEGVPMVIKTRDFKIAKTNPFHEKAALMGFIKQWAEFAPTSGFDTASLVGRGAEIRIEHKPNRDGTRFYANLTVVLPVDAEDGGKVPRVEMFADLLHPIEQQAPKAAGADVDGDEIPF